MKLAAFLKIALTALALYFGSTSAAYAVCWARPTNGVWVRIDLPPAKINVPATAQVGDLVYQRVFPFELAFNTAPLNLTCNGSGNVLNLYDTCSETSRCATNNSSFTYAFEVEKVGAGYSAATLTLPNGNLTDPVSARARLKIYLHRLPVSASRIFATTTAINMMNGTYAANNVPFIRFAMEDNSRTVTTSCSMTTPSTIALPTIGRSRLTRVGAVETGATNFAISLRCSGESQVSAIGISFDGAYEHSSHAAGVIRVDQTAGVNATGVALQIVNRATSSPIGFGSLERGDTPLTNNGTYSYPFTVKYYQTEATPTAGSVRGRVTVNVMMQ